MLVYVDDLLVAAESPQEGESFLQQLHKNKNLRFGKTGVCLFSVTVSCPFPSRFFGQSLSCATGEHCWTMLTSEVM